MKKSNTLKHVPITPIEEAVDAAMRYLPRDLDLSQTEARMKVRAWMVRIGEVIARDIAENSIEAAKKAIGEAAVLAVNPKYYEERKGRREKYKIQRAAQKKSETPSSRAEREFLLLKDTQVKM